MHNLVYSETSNWTLAKQRRYQCSIYETVDGFDIQEKSIICDEMVKNFEKGDSVGQNE